jgi:hypothetical protein
MRQCEVLPFVLGPEEVGCSGRQYSVSCEPYTIVSHVSKRERSIWTTFISRHPREDAAEYARSDRNYPPCSKHEKDRRYRADRSSGRMVMVGLTSVAEGNFGVRAFNIGTTHGFREGRS